MPRSRASPPLTEAAIVLGLNRILTRGLMRLVSKRIRAHQDALRVLVSAEAWQAYLRVEEASNQRLDAALQRAACWGLPAGPGGAPEADVTPGLDEAR